MSSTVRVDVQDRIATVWIDRQEKLNALNPDVITELGQAFDGLRTNDDVGAVIVTGAGGKAFVAGADIGVLATMDPLKGIEVSRQGQGVFRSIERFPKPVVAAVGGYALGGGCELALACHMRVASDRARFGLPEVGLGIIPGYGGTIRLTRLVGLGRAIELTLSGEMVKADRALELGLVNRVVSHDDLLEETRAFLSPMLAKGPVAVRLALESLYGAVDTSSEEALKHESALFGVLASTKDMKEGMAAFLEKREPDFEGR